MTTARTLLASLVLACALTLPAATAHGQASGIIGPRNATLPSGQRLQPAGGGIRLGNFSDGGTLTPDGRFWWSASTGWGANDVRIVDVPSHGGQCQVAGLRADERQCGLFVQAT